MLDSTRLSSSYAMRTTSKTNVRARILQKPTRNLFPGLGLALATLSLSACGGSEEEKVHDTTLTLSFADGVFTATDVEGFALPDPTTATLVISDAPGDAISVQLVANGRGVLQFQFNDAQDVVTLEAGSIISGFSTLRVVEGTVDATFATISDVVRVEVASGIKLTLAQVREIPVLVSNSETGTIEIAVSTVAEAQELATLISTGTVALFGEAASITVVPVVGSSVTVEEIAEQVAVVVAEAVRPAAEAPPPPAEVTPPAPAPAPPAEIDTPPPSPTFTATFDAVTNTITFGGTATGDISASLSESGATLTFERGGLTKSVDIADATTLTITKPTGVNLNLTSAPNTVLRVKDDGPTVILNKETDIQAAIDKAEASETVLVGSGVFDGNVTLNKEGVTLKSLGGSEIKGIVRLEADDIVIDGFKLDGTEQTGNDRGLQIAGGDGIIVRNMEISKFLTGASLDFASDLGIPKNVTFTGNTFSENTAGIGSTEGVTGLTISNNTFIDNVEGIGLGVGVELKDDKSVKNLGEDNTFTFNLASNHYAIGDYRDGATKFYNDEGAIIVFAGGSIQAAIDAAKDGDTIFVAAGKYDGNVVLNKAIQLVGPNATTEGHALVRSGEAIIGGKVTISANDASLKGFTFTTGPANTQLSDTTFLSWDMNSVLVTGDEVILANNIIKVFGGQTGKSGFVQLSGATTFSGNVVKAGSGYDAANDARGASAVWINAGTDDNVTVSNNHLLVSTNVIATPNDADAIFLNNAGVVVIDGNLIQGTDGGFVAFGNYGDLTITNNTITEYAKTGLRIFESTASEKPEVFVSGNIIDNSGDRVMFVNGPVQLTVEGTAGNDTIVGGAGNDDIDISSGGSDLIIFGATATANGVDTITGFTAGAATDPEADKLDFSLFAIDGNATANAAGGADIVSVTSGVDNALEAGKVTIVNFNAAISANDFGAAGELVSICCSVQRNCSALLLLRWRQSYRRRSGHRPDRGLLCYRHWGCYRRNRRCTSRGS
jgi:nitrous oxidase accessory protein NosD